MCADIAANVDQYIFENKKGAYMSPKLIKKAVRGVLTRTYPWLIPTLSRGTDVWLSASLHISQRN